LLLLATYRKSEVHERPALLDCLAYASRRLHLRGLHPEDVGRLVEMTTGGAAPELVADLHRITEGNPFFLGAFMRMLEAEGGVLGPDLPSLRTKLPAKLRTTIRRRLAPLAVEDRQLLDVAAVVGQEFDAALLRVACALPADRVLERLGPAVAT